MIEKLVRPTIQTLQPYSSARDEFKQDGNTPLNDFVFLDANENSYGSAIGNYNRYPDPQQKALKKAIAHLKKVQPNQIFLGNGSDEAIDLLFRVFCEPKEDNVIILPPTYGMYEVAANINNVALQKISLTPDFQLDIPAILSAINAKTKIIFVCSPNNPTANLIDPKSIEVLLERFAGIVVVDEAYIDFSSATSWTQSLTKYPNLVVLQTFSKLWGLAALRLGMAFASPEIIGYLNKVKPPYNINGVTQVLVLSALENSSQVESWKNTILKERELLVNSLGKLPQIEKIYPSDANFILVKVQNADAVYKELVNSQIVVRNRSKVTLCENCLRITIGTPEENILLINTLKKLL
jgi:histidinol-phosphate aminotransferase